MPQLTQDQLVELSKAASYEWNTLTQYYDTSDWIKILKELGFVEVAGRWVKMIPSYASTVKQSVTTAGAVAGTTASVYETVTSPVTSIIASNTGTKVTTGGILTATSTSVGAVACASALGFVTGVNMFEAAPEFWTKVSNAVFQTDLDPEEIGRIARDTNALVMIKDGVCYMAEDMINAIRNALFENGAANTTAQFPPVDLGAVTVESFGNIQDFLSSEFYEPFDGWSFNAKGNELLDEIKAYNGMGFVEITHSSPTIPSTDKVTARIYLYTANGSTPLDCTLIKSGEDYILRDFYKVTGKAYIFEGNVRYQSFSNAYSISVDDSYTTIYYGQYTKNRGYDRVTSSINAKQVSYIPSITPTGEQGTKEQTLDEVFPDWVAKAVTTIGDFPDVVRRWLPVTLPSTQVETEGSTLTTTEAQTGAMPKAGTEAATQTETNTDTDTTTKTGEAISPTPLPTPTPTPTPTPSDPSISGGGGSATGLANLYNPTLAQVKEFSHWLWGSDGLNLDQLKKLLQDPMQAIIGLHVMYATPSTGAERGIQVGYINSGVNSKIVTEQYAKIDCGTVTINEYFGDAREPFIGIVELNADDVVNSTLGIKYKIDVLTGCCLAQLTVKKYGLDAVLYTYTGNCAVQMPITSGNYLSTVSTLLRTVASGAAAVATGGALAPVAIGAAANALGGGPRASVAMSGSLGSNAGAMGIRKPYLIIKRVEQADANGYNEFYGYPTNKRVNLSQLSGYVRVKDINLSGTNATEEEQNEIVALLREGVIL